MRRFLVFFLITLIAVASTEARADTIHLKNGSVIKGKVASFADDQFIVVLDAGSGRSMSRAMIYIGDVARIEFDSAPQLATEAQPRDTTPTQTVQPTDTTPARDTTPRETISRDTTPRRSQTSEPPPAGETVIDPAISNPTKEQRDPAEGTRPEKTVSSQTPTTEVADLDRAPRKLTGQVRTANIDVMAKRDWTSTGLIVKRGDRIRITAAGTVMLDPSGSQTSGPEGTEIADSRKLMQDQPTGALIGVIGADNDDFIFIGRAAEFTAVRDGLLFLSVNEGALSDNTGSYKAAIEVQSQGGRRP